MAASAQVDVFHLMWIAARCGDKKSILFVRVQRNSGPRFLHDQIKRLMRGGVCLHTKPNAGSKFFQKKKKKKKKKKSRIKLKRVSISFSQKRGDALFCVCGACSALCRSAAA